MIQFHEHIFQMGWGTNHQLVMLCDRWWMALEAALGVTFVDVERRRSEGGSMELERHRVKKTSSWTTIYLKKTRDIRG